MAEPMALRLHDNQSFQDQLGTAVHPTEVQPMAHLKYQCFCILGSFTNNCSLDCTVKHTKRTI
eukprot:scaffold55554_cov58-Attheya_sp.AAC.2